MKKAIYCWEEPRLFAFRCPGFRGRFVRIGIALFLGVTFLGIGLMVDSLHDLGLGLFTDPLFTAIFLYVSVKNARYTRESWIVIPIAGVICFFLPLPLSAFSV